MDSLKDKETQLASELLKLKQVVTRLRSVDGCPWDKIQTHESLKPECIEEAAEVIGGINIWKQTGNAENLKEELGDLLLQIVMHAEIAEEEGLFDLGEVMHGITEKMIRRHPQVFEKSQNLDSEERKKQWETIKQQEKKGKEWMAAYLPDSFEESKLLLEAAKKRKGFDLKKGPVEGIHHVSMKCCNEEEYAEVLRFYRDILGIPVIRSWKNGVMLDTGSGLLEVFTDGDEALPKGVIRHFALAVSDVDACITAVREAGYEVFIEPKDIVIASKPEFPARIAFCKGPLGEEIEFFCEK